MLEKIDDQSLIKRGISFLNYRSGRKIDVILEDGELHRGLGQKLALYKSNTQQKTAYGSTSCLSIVISDNLVTICRLVEEPKAKFKPKPKEPDLQDGIRPLQ